MILIALSANLPGPFGSPADTLRAACDELTRRGLRVTLKSRIWKTAPVPVSDQPWYCNAVVKIETDFTPHEAMQVLLDIEKDFGRVRTYRNAARIVDLDILAWDDLIIGGHALTIPHMRLHERAFVLLPLRDIAPSWVHPATGLDVAQMIAALPPGQDAVPEENLDTRAA